MGQSESKREREKAIFGDKTAETFNSYYKNASKSLKERKKKSPNKPEERSYEFEKLPVFEEPMCLISTDDAGNFHIEDEVLTQIKEIFLDIVVISIAGLYRTGKSYLMNRIAGKSEGFALGNSIESKTKGIWVWCRRHPVKENTVLVLLDTEGLGDIAKGDIGYDNKIFTLAALLCNVLVYNILNVFDQYAVEKLTFITEMSKSIGFKNITNDANSDCLALILPTFVLTLRDFTLKLEKGGKQITADEYLDYCLDTTSGAGSERFNRPRECIKMYFRRRRCFKFAPPGDAEIIQNLQNVDLSLLSQNFKKDTETFLQFVYSCEPKRLLHSKPVTGQMFATLVESYVNSIKNGGIPDVDDAFQAVSNIENERRATEAVEKFREHLKEIELPIPKSQEFDQLCQDLINESLENFRSEAVLNSEKFEQRAIVDMKTMCSEKKEENHELGKSFCEKELHDVYNKVFGNKVQKRKFHKAGGHEKYKLKRKQVNEEFRKRVKDFDDLLVQSAISTLWSEEQDQIEQEIIDFDKKLSEEEKENEKKLMQNEHDEWIQRFQTLLEDNRKASEKREDEFKKELEEQRKMHSEQEHKKVEKLESELSILKKKNEAFLTIQIRDNPLESAATWIKSWF